jgi:hypothetical protein
MAAYLGGLQFLDTHTLQQIGRWPTVPSYGVRAWDERGLLYIVNFWGIEVWDIEAQAPLARRRLGGMPRRPSFDPESNVVFVGTTLGGRLWALDPTSLETISVQETGFGMRETLVVEGTGRVLGSTLRDHRAWSIADM